MLFMATLIVLYGFIELGSVFQMRNTTFPSSVHSLQEINNTVHFRHHPFQFLE